MTSKAGRVFSAVFVTGFNIYWIVRLMIWLFSGSLCTSCIKAAVTQIRNLLKTNQRDLLESKRNKFKFF